LSPALEASFLIDQIVKRSCNQMKIDRTLRFGYGLSLLSLLLVLVYLWSLIAALASGSFPPAGVYERTISVVTLLVAPVLVLLWATTHQVTPPERKVFSLASLVFIAVFAALTSINRYNALTVVPQATAMGVSEGLDWFLPYGWPSIMAAMEVLAWGGYYGLACLCLAPVFGKTKLGKAISWTLFASGGLALVSVLGQVLNNIPLNALGILAWGPGLILLSVLWARWFKVQEDR
jgi:hypothetical protein